MGQVSHFNEEDAATICEALADGHSLLSICEAMGLPHSTARNWERDHPEHGANATRAREIGCHALAEQALQIADTPCMGEEVTVKADGTEEVRRGDMYQHRRLQIDTRKWLISKWSPKTYGDKQQVEHSGEMTINGLAGRMRAKRADADQ